MLLERPIDGGAPAAPPRRRPGRRWIVPAALIAVGLVAVGSTMVAGWLRRPVPGRSSRAGAHELRALLLLRSGDYDRGLAHLGSAAELDPADPRPWIDMARAYRDLGRDEEAADSYQAALGRDPADRETRLDFIAAALRAQQPDRATPRLVEAMREAPGDPRVVGLAARHALALGHPEQAAGFAGGALAGDPDNIDALVARSTARSLRGDQEGALADVERAARVDPANAEVLRLLGQVEARRGRDDRARASLARAQEIEDRRALFRRLAEEIHRRPDAPEPRWRMGQVAAQLKRPEIAAGSFRAALAIDPDCRPARIGLADLEGRRAGTAPPR